MAHIVAIAHGRVARGHRDQDSAARIKKHWSIRSHRMPRDGSTMECTRTARPVSRSRFPGVKRKRSRIVAPLVLVLGLCHLPRHSSFQLLGRHAGGCPTWQRHPSLATGLRARPDFDFSSAVAWEGFYRDLYDAAHSESDHRAVRSVVEEWHGSIPLEVIAELVVNQFGHSTVPSMPRSCLLVGCGTSQLPSVLSAVDSQIHLTLLDASETCITQMAEKYRDNPRIGCLCDDATRLGSVSDGSVDAVLDKGFLDVLLCGEGWDGSVVQSLTAACRVLRPGGKYIWIGYRVPQSTTDFIADSVPGLHWDDENPASTDRVSIRIATKVI